MPVVAQASFDASTLTRATPLPDVFEPIIFDPDEPDDAPPTRAVEVGADGRVA